MSDSETHLTDAELAAVRALIENSSLAVVAKRFKVALQTLRTVSGGMKGNRSTIAFIRQGIAAIDREGEGLEVQLKDPDGDDNGGLR